MTVCSFHDKSQTSWVRCLGSLLVQAPPCPTLVTGSRESLKVAESRHSPHSNGKMSAIKSFIVLLVVRINQTSRGGRTLEEAGASGVFMNISSLRRVASLSEDVNSPDCHENFASLLFFVCISQQLHDLKACSHTSGTSHSCSCLVAIAQYQITSFTLNWT